MLDKILKMFNLEGLIDNAKGYVETRIQMAKVEVLEKASNIIATLFILLILAFMLSMMLIFASLALGNYLNSLFNSTYIGFAIMALFFFILVILLVVSISKGYFHKKVKKVT